RREGLNAVGAEGHRHIPRLAVAESSATDRRITRGAGGGRAGAGHSWRRTVGDLVERPEAAVVQVVVCFGDDVAVGELCLKMDGVRRVVERADNGLPTGAVWQDRPQAPDALIAESLRLEAAEYHAAVAQDGRVQRRTEIDVADHLDVLAVVVHGKQLQARPSV